MIKFQRVWMTLAVAVALIAAFGAPQSGLLTAASQHQDDAAAHFEAIAQRLALTQDQREQLLQPFHEAFAALQQLHDLHAVIAAELTDGQRRDLADLIHESMAASTSHESHGEHHPEGGDR